ncbi:DUF2281 domain-containing protein [Spirosoma sp. KCTC 42546]|uniref:DUF2281 domain-containing protein n=1 Tax=Spirosoma sp. KCTC 42546 TaxID=2520506 RepID=UPI0011590966|nr:DUF2281 domain-containing protein [Spirosoma sp. KCTC 42546]QDK83246.1 DUF2281 domain-containing protein [Spirosoma sp. KCTC 42546]
MLTAVKGTFGHGQIILHEIPSIPEGTEVIVTFLENETKEKPQKTGIHDKQGIRFGSLTGKVSVPADFNEPLDDLSEYM